MIKNEFFEIDFNVDNGTVSALRMVGDGTQASFVKEGRNFLAFRGLPWGKIVDGVLVPCLCEPCELKSFTESQTEAVTVYKKRGLIVTQRVALSGDEIYFTTTVLNGNAHPFYFSDGDMSFELPLPDSYEGSEVCERLRTHAHISDTLENSYFLAERMGESTYNLGGVLLSGSVASYSQEGCKGNDRGVFVLNAEGTHLLGGEEYRFEFVLFRYQTRADFWERTKRYPSFIRIQTKEYTVEKGKPVEICLEAGEKVRSARATGCAVRVDKNRAIATFTPKSYGEKAVEYSVNGRRGIVKFNATKPFFELVETRIRFIVNNQQCLDKNSPLYGAYLIWDNVEQRQYFSYDWTDQNANRERLGMSLTIAKWLQTHEDKKVRKSLELFKDFLLRECVDENTGRTYNNIGKDPRVIRLYNAPWVILFFTEYTKATNDTRYVPLIVKMITYYYENGGTKFYPNGVRFIDYARVVKAHASKEDYDKICALFSLHVKTILDNGTAYPPHEVNFEQTIVTPAVSLLLDAYLVFGEQKYLREAEKHLSLLRKFDGDQPDHKRYALPIRYWDDFFFGKTKERTYGDTLHYWSVLSGFDYTTYGKLTGKKEWIDYGKQTTKNSTGLVFPDGKGSCAYLHAETVNGIKGRRYNSFANDQDFALYFSMRLEEEP